MPRRKPRRRTTLTRDDWLAEAMELDEGAFYLACPDPSVHRVTAIEAGPQRLAPVVTP